MHVRREKDTVECCGGTNSALLTDPAGDNPSSFIFSREGGGGTTAWCS